MKPREIWLSIAGLGAILAIASILVTQWLQLDPCHLCIFQRLLFIVLGLLAIAAAFSVRHLAGRLLGACVLLVAVAGAGVSGYQSWIQIQPLESGGCTGGDLGLIEQFIEWLGQQLPTLFMATGFCDDIGLLVLGLSLANWALISFAACGAAALWALIVMNGANRIDAGSPDGSTPER